MRYRWLVTRFLHALIIAAAILTFVNERRADALARPSTARLWPGGTVPVCFDQSLVYRPNFDKFARVTRTNVENTWGRVANLRFTGWGTCPTVWPAGTVVLYFEPGAFNAMIGYSPYSATTLKLDFNTSWDGHDQPRRWADIVVHEFGHLIGFEHEMDRADNPYFTTGVGCTPDGGGPKSTVNFTPYDANSIMAYDVSGPRVGCGIGWVGWAPTMLKGLPPGEDWFQPISAWDVAGAQAAYGVKPAGTLVGLGGKCVNIYGGSHNWGSSLIAYDCYDVENERFTRSQNGTDLTLVAQLWDFAPYANLALDVPNAYLNGGLTPLWDYPINNSPAQQFTFTGTQWKAYGDMCVVADGAVSDAQLRVVTCSSTASLQRWDFEPNGRIRLSGTSLCTNVPWGSAFSGNYMKLYPCGYFSPYENELFTMTDRGEITYKGMCMNVWGGHMGEYSPLALYACSPTAVPYANEVFYASGPIRGLGGQCLENQAFPDGVGRNYQPIGVAPCNGNYSQNWDYRFKRRW